MRTAKFCILITGLALLSVHCNGSKPAPDAWASMAKNKVVRIATNPYNVPFESGDVTGVQGFDVDLGNEIAKDLNYDPKWIKVDEFGRILEILKNGEVEMVISTVAIIEERKKEFAFSDPYFESSNTIARRRDNNEIKDLASLAGKKVGVQEGRTGDRFMTEQKTAANVTVSRFKVLDDALGALNRGEIDAVVGDKPIMTYSIAKSAYATNLITTDVELLKTQYGVVVRPEETKLLAKVNETIARLKNAKQFDAWYDKWFGSVMTDTSKEILKIEEQERLKVAPKTININFVKESGSPVKLDRLDGFNAALSGTGGNFTSTPITTDEAGVRGSCRFTSPIPPGEYRLILSRLQVNQAITVEKRPVSAFTWTLTFKSSGNLDINVR